MYWRRGKSPGLLACTVHTRGPNHGIGRQKSNRIGLIPRKQNGGFPQEASNLVFNDAVVVVFIPQKWVFTVKLDKDSGRGNAPSCFDRSPSLSDSFSAILKKGAMEGEF